MNPCEGDRMAGGLGGAVVDRRGQEGAKKTGPVSERLAEGIETLLPCLPTVLTLAGLTIDRKARLHGGQCAAEDRHCDGLNTELRSTPTTAIQVLGMGR